MILCKKDICKCEACGGNLLCDDTTIIFAWKKESDEKEKILTTTTEHFEYKHKTTVINIEETHII